MNTMQQKSEQRRLRRRARLIKDVRSLWLSGGEASNLRESKIAALADRLSFTLGDDYSLIELDRAVGFTIRQHTADLKATDAEKHARGMKVTDVDPKSVEWHGLTPDQRLERANQIEALKRLEAQRAEAESDAD